MRQWIIFIWIGLNQSLQLSISSSSLVHLFTHLLLVPISSSHWVDKRQGTPWMGHQCLFNQICLIFYSFFLLSDHIVSFVQVTSKAASDFDNLKITIFFIYAPVTQKYLNYWQVSMLLQCSFSAGKLILLTFIYSQGFKPGICSSSIWVPDITDGMQSLDCTEVMKLSKYICIHIYRIIRTFLKI